MFWVSQPGRGALGPGMWGRGPLGKGPWQRRGTCAGVPVLSQLVALAAVALVGAVDVCALLAAALGLTLVHICRRRARVMAESSQPRHEGQGPCSPGASSEETLHSSFPPRAHGNWRIRKGQGANLGHAAQAGACGGVPACCLEEAATDWAQVPQGE